MGLFPICMNIIQFWIIDSIVKASAVYGSGVPPDEEGVSQEDRAPLMPPSNDDDDQEDGHAVANEDNPSPQSTRVFTTVPGIQPSVSPGKGTNLTSQPSPPRHVNKVQEQHSYPPSLPSLSSSPSSIRSNPSIPILPTNHKVPLPTSNPYINIPSEDYLSKPNILDPRLHRKDLYSSGPANTWTTSWLQDAEDDRPSRTLQDL